MSNCQTAGTHCENCGRPVNPWHTMKGQRERATGRTLCCNKLVAFGPYDCRNHHENQEAGK